MFLKTILERKRLEIEERKKDLPFGQLSRLVSDRMSTAETPSEKLRAQNSSRDAAPSEEFGAAGPVCRSFGTAISGPGLSLICEYKKASPSKGDIRTDLEVEAVVRSYEAGGAAAISVVTERSFFKGEPAFLQRAKAATKLPLLMKDFVIDEYQMFTARLLDASAILLIAAALSRDELVRYLPIARDLGLDALVEVHCESELETALTAGARIVGVNNRDLRTFQTSLHTAERLSALIPDGVCKVAESGISTVEDASRMANAGFDALLIGEALMKAANPEGKVRELLSAGAAS